MESFEDLVVGEKKPVSANMWGWKWSWISLVVIMISLLFLVFVGPREGSGNSFDEESNDTTTIVNENNN